jgi:DNA-binding response OmpR family regulator
MTVYTLRTHVMQLKKKLGEDVIIKNLSGQGYILNVLTC